MVFMLGYSQESHFNERNFRDSPGVVVIWPCGTKWQIENGKMETNKNVVGLGT